MGLDFPNPIGLAAGFDKNAEVMHSMFSFGFGFLEVGTITPQPQSGNPKPRVFRLSEDKAIINSCLLYTSPSPRDKRQSRMPSSA